MLFGNYTSATVRFWSLVLPCLFLLNGCTYLKELIGLGPQRPEVSIRNIAVEGISLHSVDLRLTLHVENPNSFELVLGTLSYTIDAVGMAIAKGEYSDTFKVPAKSSNQIKLPLTVDARNILKLINEIMKARGEKIEAVTNLRARFITPVGSMDVNIKDEQPLTTSIKI